MTNNYDFRSLELLLKACPGPSPWYPSAGTTIKSQKFDSLQWIKDDARRQLQLRNSSQIILTALGFYTWSMLLPAHRVALWTMVDDVHLNSKFWQLDILDLNLLEPLDDYRGATVIQSGNEFRYAFRGGRIAQTRIPTSLDYGVNVFGFPDAFKEFSELLLLGTNASQGPCGTSPGHLPLCIYVVRPKSGTVEVIPQDWYNKGNFDFGYQWITKIGRESVSGRLVGTGTRLDHFVLDESGRNRELRFRDGKRSENPFG